VHRIAKFNRSSTSKLLLGGRLSVFSGRVIAASVGRGAIANHMPMWAKAAFNLRRMVEELNRDVYRWLFLRGTSLRITHPYWLLRRSCVAAALTHVGASDRPVAVIGSEGVIDAMKRARPDHVILAVQPGSVPKRQIESLKEKGVPVLAVQYGAKKHELPPALLKLSGAGLKCHLVHDGFADVAANAAFSVERAGGAGTRLCSQASRLEQISRSFMNWLRGPLRPLVRTLGIMGASIVYLITALFGLVLNAAGLLLDAVTPQRRPAEQIAARTLTTQQIGKGQ
jgi:hypothetical protein